MQKNFLASTLAIGALALSACSGDTTGSQDVPSNDRGGTQSRAFHARAVDGYLAGATVYVDLNENATLDAFEPRAITDSDGFFSYNHINDTDYCAGSAAAWAQHCLKGAIAAGEQVLIRVTGGYDTITGLPFKGTLSLRSNELDRDDLRLVTPQTSMVADADSSAQERIDALVRAGILNPGGSFDTDHIGAGLSEQMTRAQVATIVSRLLGQAADVATHSSVFQDLASDTWHMGYLAMAKELVLDGAAGGSGTFGGVFSDSSVSVEMMRAIAFSYMNPDATMPENFTLPNEASAAPLLQFAAELVDFNEELIAAMQSETIATEQARAALRVTALAAERALQNPQDPELADLFAWARNQIAQGDGLGSDLTGLGADNIDLSTLIEPSFDFDPLSNSVSASATIPAEAANAFAALVNTAFGVSVNKSDERGAALLFIGGTNGARAGDLNVCVRYRDDDGDFNTGSSTDPNGAMLVTGRWSLLNNHTLTLSVDVVGGVRPLLLKSVGVIGTDRKYRFDFGGDLSEWSGSAPAGFAAGAVPASDAACKTALIERFGPIN